MTIKQCNLLFSLRARMVSVRCNYKKSYNDLTCQICQDQSQLDTQIHLLSCKELLKDENLVVRHKISYSDIFSKNVQKQSEVTKCFEYFVQEKKTVREKVI